MALAVTSALSCGPERREGWRGVSGKRGSHLGLNPLLRRAWATPSQARQNQAARLFRQTTMSQGNAPAGDVPGPSPTPQPVASSSKLTAEREKRRISLRQSNWDVWQSGPQPPSGPLDSNMKKNTGFIKRVRQSLGVESKEQLIKEVATLNLDKYIDEVIQAIPEGLAKCTSAKDCGAAAEVSAAQGQALRGRLTLLLHLFVEPLGAPQALWRCCICSAAVPCPRLCTFGAFADSAADDPGRPERAGRASKSGQAEGHDAGNC